MAFKLIRSAGQVVEPAFLEVYASGTISPNTAAEFLTTGGTIIGPAGITTTQTAIFGVTLDYAQGVSDTQVKVIPFMDSQLWEVDCANAASTAQIGIKHGLSASRGYIHNTASNKTGLTGVFLALVMTGATTGSGKLIGRFISRFVEY